MLGSTPFRLLISEHFWTITSSEFSWHCAPALWSAALTPHICWCGTFVNEFGLHGLKYQRSAGRQPRHTEINAIISQALSSIHVNSTLEPPGLFRDDGKRPDGLSLVPWANGRHLVWDAICWDTLAPSHINASRGQAGRVTEISRNPLIPIQKFSSGWVSKKINPNVSNEFESTVTVTILRLN